VEVWNAQVTETACKQPGTEAAGNENGMYATLAWKARVRKPQVKVRSVVNSGVGAHTYITDNSCNARRCVDEMANVRMYQCNTGYKFEHNGQYCM